MARPTNLRAAEAIRDLLTSKAADHKGSPSHFHDGFLPGFINPDLVSAFLKVPWTPQDLV